MYPYKGNYKKSIPWPVQLKNKMITAHLFLACVAFPTLFLYEKGNWFDQERRVGVSLVEYNKTQYSLYFSV